MFWAPFKWRTEAAAYNDTPYSITGPKEHKVWVQVCRLQHKWFSVDSSRPPRKFVFISSWISRRSKRLFSNVPTCVLPGLSSHSWKWFPISAPYTSTLGKLMNNSFRSTTADIKTLRQYFFAQYAAMLVLQDDARWLFTSVCCVYCV